MIPTIVPHHFPINIPLIELLFTKRSNELEPVTREVKYVRDFTQQAHTYNQNLNQSLGTSLYRRDYQLSADNDEFLQTVALQHPLVHTKAKPRQDSRKLPGIEIIRPNIQPLFDVDDAMDSLSYIFDGDIPPSLQNALPRSELNTSTLSQSAMSDDSIHTDRTPSMHSGGRDGGMRSHSNRVGHRTSSSNRSNGGGPRSSGRGGSQDLPRDDHHFSQRQQRGSISRDHRDRDYNNHNNQSFLHSGSSTIASSHQHRSGHHRQQQQQQQFRQNVITSTPSEYDRYDHPLLSSPPQPLMSPNVTMRRRQRDSSMLSSRTPAAGGGATSSTSIEPQATPGSGEVSVSRPSRHRRERTVYDFGMILDSTPATQPHTQQHTQQQQQRQQQRQQQPPPIRERGGHLGRPVSTATASGDHHTHQGRHAVALPPLSFHDSSLMTPEDMHTTHAPTRSRSRGDDDLRQRQRLPPSAASHTSPASPYPDGDGASSFLYFSSLMESLTTASASHEGAGGEEDIGASAAADISFRDLDRSGHSIQQRNIHNCSEHDTSYSLSPPQYHIPTHRHHQQQQHQENHQEKASKHPTSKRVHHPFELDISGVDMLDASGGMLPFSPSTQGGRSYILQLGGDDSVHSISRGGQDSQTMRGGGGGGGAVRYQHDTSHSHHNYHSSTASAENLSTLSGISNIYSPIAMPKNTYADDYRYGTFGVANSQQNSQRSGGGIDDSEGYPAQHKYHQQTPYDDDPYDLPDYKSSYPRQPQAQAQQPRYFADDDDDDDDIFGLIDSD